MESRRGWVEREVLEGFDLRGFPSFSLRPVDAQHVVRELLPEHQGVRIRLGLQVMALLYSEISGLPGGQVEREGGRKERERENKQKGGGGSKANMRKGREVFIHDH